MSKIVQAHGFRWAAAARVANVDGKDGRTDVIPNEQNPLRTKGQWPHRLDPRRTGFQTQIVETYRGPVVDHENLLRFANLNSRQCSIPPNALPYRSPKYASWSWRGR